MPPSSDQRLFDAQPAEHDAVDAERRHREDVEDADVERRRLQVDRAVADLEHVAERHHGERRRGPGMTAMHGRQRVQQAVGAGGTDVFLQEELDRVGDQRVDEPVTRRSRRSTARFAPMRSWMMALTLRSKKTPMPIDLERDQQDRRRPWRTRWRRRYPSILPAALSAISRPRGDRAAPPARGRRGSRGSRVVHLHHRRRAAAGQALDLLEREAAVGGALRRADAEAALDGRAQLRRSRAARTTGSRTPGDGAGPSARFQYIV